MASGAFICAHDNEFNRAVLGADACYFSNENDIASAIKKNHPPGSAPMIKANLDKIQGQYTWQQIINGYEEMMVRALEK
jgi:hypothetical protein